LPIIDDLYLSLVSIPLSLSFGATLSLDEFSQSRLSLPFRLLTVQGDQWFYSGMDSHGCSMPKVAMGVGHGHCIAWRAKEAKAKIKLMCIVVWCRI